MPEIAKTHKLVRAALPPTSAVIASLMHDHEAADHRHLAGTVARRLAIVSRQIGPVAGEGRGHGSR
jgi:hypothetical protein